MSFLWYWPAGGWNFDAWKKAHSWDPVKSEQSGRHDFLSLKDFEKSRPHWQQISDAILGKLADKPPAKPQWEWLGDEFTRDKSPTYTMRRLRYRLTDEEWGYAWLLVPKDAKGRTATVIALHQTHPHGKNEPVGLEANPDSEDRGLHYGVHLVEKGFIVFAPDAIAFGERSGGHQNAKYRSADEFFAAHPEGSIMRKMQFDVSRGIDALEQMPNVDANRIGCIGHSHGAYGTLFAMLGDDRIKTGVISCGFSALRLDPRPERWWKSTALMPRLGFYEGNMDQTPIDFHIWLALLAPRPVMIIAGTEDTIFPNSGQLPPLVDQVRNVYATHGAESKFIADIYKGPHNFPRSSRAQAYKLLSDVLVEPPQKSDAGAALGAAAVAGLPGTKTYRVPETRFPFVNSEVAESSTNSLDRKAGVISHNPNNAFPLNDSAQLQVHAMCVAPERNLIIGGSQINSSLWTIDLTTGQGADQGRAIPGGGRINQIVWDAGRHRALMSADTATVIEYDPAEPAHWPANSRVIASGSHEEQMRPRALIFDRRYAWMATSPTNGQLGGALSRIDPETNEIKTWRNIVPDQTINALALDLKRRRIYLSSEIVGDMNSVPPTQSTAQLVAFDMDKLTVARRMIVREGAPNVAVLCVLPDGRVLVHEGMTYHACNPDAQTFHPVGDLPGFGPVIPDQTGVLWASLNGSIGRVEVGTSSIHFTPVLQHNARHLQIEADILYYAVGTTIYATPLGAFRNRLS